MKQVKLWMVALLLVLGSVIGLGVHALHPDQPALLQMSKGIGCDECGMG